MTAPGSPKAGSPSGRETPLSKFIVGVGIAALLGLILRIAAVSCIPSVPVSDFWSYLHRAMNLALHGRYEAIPGMPGAYLSPGYPVFLAAAFKVFGVSVGLCKALNVLLGATSIVLLGLGARELFGEKVGLLAALILCLSPRAILMSCLLASENLAAPLVIGSLLACSRWSGRRGGLGQPAVAGAILGAAGLTRSVSLVLLLLWPVTGLLRRRRGTTLLVETGILAAACFAILLPWGFWNLRHFGRFTISTTTAGVNLYMGNQASSTGSWIGDWRARLEKQRPEIAGMNEAEVDRVARSEARAWIARQPLGFAHLYVRKLWLFCAGMDPTNAADFAVFYRKVEPPWPGVDVLPGPHYLKSHPGLLIWLLRLEYWALAGLAMGGLGVALGGLWRGPPVHFEIASVGAVVVAITSFPLMTSFFVVVDRFRWPMEDFLMPLAAIGIISLVCRQPARSRQVRQ